ncbi:MAG: hypothetical protein EHM68_13515 [Lysobacterales bacterium]|nr:MAG: hypothetical protein EHM68_13515 [Xanthomonadales bacterium]
MEAPNECGGKVGFSNVQIDLDALPRFDSVAFQPVDPRHKRVVLALAAGAELVVLFLLFSLLALSPDARALFAGLPGALIILGVLAVAAALAGFAYASASVIRYAVREHDVIVHKGVFFQRETIQPIRRIQHVEQLQGPVARRFGLYSIRLFSAGTAKFAFEIPGLSADTAARLRQAILQRREEQRTHAPAPLATNEADDGR